MFFHGRKHCLFDTDVSVDLPVYLLSQGPSWALGLTWVLSECLSGLVLSRAAEMLRRSRCGLRSLWSLSCSPDQFALAQGTCVSAGGLVAP